MGGLEQIERCEVVGGVHWGPWGWPTLLQQGVAQATASACGRSLRGRGGWPLAPLHKKILDFAS